MADGIRHRLLDIADHGRKSRAFDVHIDELGVSGLFCDLQADAERRFQRRGDRIAMRPIKIDLKKGVEPHNKNRAQGRDARCGKGHGRINQRRKIHRVCS